MATNKAIYEMEHKRATVDDFRKIYLHASGTFYNMYEVSAWLWYFHVADFKINHHSEKSVDGTLLSTGCPVRTLMNHLPKGAVQGVADGCTMVITLPALKEGMPQTVEELNAEFEKWKAAQPVTERKPAPKESAQAQSGPAKASDKKHSEPNNGQEREYPRSLFGVARRILDFSVANHTPKECMEFIEEIQRILRDLLF